MCTAGPKVQSDSSKRQVQLTMLAEIKCVQTKGPNWQSLCLAIQGLLAVTVVLVSQGAGHRKQHCQWQLDKIR
jgi:hypothetical protein